MNTLQFIVGLGSLLVAVVVAAFTVSRLLDKAVKEAKKEILEIVDKVLVAHNQDKDAHGIISEIEDRVDKALDAHNKDAEAHGDMRKLILETNGKIDLVWKEVISVGREVHTYITVSNPAQLKAATDNIVARITKKIEEATRNAD